MKHIVLNPGHVFYCPGDKRNTPGKHAPDKSFYEAVWNREVATIVAHKLSEIGISSTVAVAESESVSLSSPVRICNNICSKLGAGNVLFISIHVNALGNGSEWMSARGWSIFTTRGVTKSDRLAESIYKVAKEKFLNYSVRSEYSDGDADYESNFYVIKNVQCPAVLVENFFMDNREDLAFLKTEECKILCAEVIVEGIKRYLNV